MNTGERATLLCVVGARPNFVKMAPIVQAFAARRDAPRIVLAHTGQHYGAQMNDRFFDTLGLPGPDYRLEAGSGSHAVQTAEVMRRFEPVVAEVAPDAVLVVGDVNSTLACALTARKMNVPVIHVEAGLRSFDRSMPEEINRVLTDCLADLLLTSEPSGAENLAREGRVGNVVFVGNVMIDTLRANLPRATPVEVLLARLGRGDLAGAPHAVFTAHRPGNVDDADSLRRTLDLLHACAERLPVLFPLHPRTRAAVAAYGLEAMLDHRHIVVAEPLAYLDMLGAMCTACAVLTDSGGMQEEALALGVPCLTLRDTTERPVTLDCGGNVLVAQSRARLAAALDDVLAGGGRPHTQPALWDGQAAARIAEATCAWLDTLTRRAA
jgi:UDP-N-acetylglucosamine 2-epimerase (non-hydrolysing)